MLKGAEERLYKALPRTRYRSSQRGSRQHRGVRGRSAVDARARDTGDRWETG